MSQFVVLSTLDKNVKIQTSRAQLKTPCATTSTNHTRLGTYGKAERLERFPVCVVLINCAGNQVDWKEEVKGQRLVELC